MKNKLMACAIISIGTAIGYFLLFVSMISAGAAVADASSTGGNYNHSMFASGNALVMGWILLFTCGIASLVMGILVLTSLNDMPMQHRGIAMATGILAIIGLGIVTVIVGLIAASKVNEPSIQDMLNQQHLEQNSNNDQNK